MDWIRNALTAIKDLLAWLRDPVAAVVILAAGPGRSHSLHKWVRKPSAKQR